MQGSLADRFPDCTHEELRRGVSRVHADGAKEVGIILDAPGPEPEYNRSRRLVMDVHSLPPQDRSEDEEFLNVQLRFEKLIRYGKFYIKRKLEKKIYTSPRERETDRLTYIEEVLVRNPLINTTGFQRYVGDSFYCKASEFKPGFLVDTMIEACDQNTLDKACQVAEDVTRFYEEIFIPEGGVSSLKQHEMTYKFLWVQTDLKAGGISFNFTTIELALTLSEENDGNDSDPDPVIKTWWSGSNKVTAPDNLVKFEHFYESKANGFKIQRQTRDDSKPAPKRLKHSETIPTEDQGTGGPEVAEEELAMDRFLKTNAMGREGSLEKEKELVELGVDEPRETGGGKETEGKEQRISVESTVKPQEEEDREMKHCETRQEEIALKPAVDNLDGVGDIDLQVGKMQRAVKSELGRPQETKFMKITVQEAMQAQREEPKSPHFKRSPRNTPADIENVNPEQMEGSRKAEIDNANQAQPGEDKSINQEPAEGSRKADVDNTNQVQPEEGSNKVNVDNTNQEQPKEGKELVEGSRKTDIDNTNQTQPKGDTKVEISNINPVQSHGNKQAGIDNTNEAQPEATKANSRGKSKATSKPSQKAKRSNNSAKKGDKKKQKSSSNKGKNTSKGRGKRAKVKE